MLKELILITNRYPFYPGEEFLKLELDFLCEKFSKVHIIPVNSVDHSKKRDLPPNVEVHHIPAFNRKKKSLFKYDGLLDRQGREWIFSERTTAGKYGIKGYGKMISWAANAVNLRNYIQNSFIEAHKGTEFVVYSYWLSLALGVAFLKEMYPCISAYSRGHGGDIYDYRHNPPYLPFKHKVIERLNRTFIISGNGVQYLSEQAGGVNANLEIARLGTLKPKGRSGSSEDGVFRIVSCSYIVPVKRLDLVAKSLADCSEKIHWTHIGDGPGREEIEQLVSILPEHVTYEFKGNMGNDEVIQFYINHPLDLFINVSSSEGIPVSIMEAFSCGIPAVATEVGGTGELVNDRNGELIPKDFDIRELARILDHAAKSSLEDREKKRMAAFDTWNEQYNAEKNYSKFSGELLGNGGAGR